MPRKKYKLNPAIVAEVAESSEGKYLLGECLVALKVSGRAIEQIELNTEQIELEVTRNGKELFASLPDVQHWVDTPEGKHWAFPKFGRRQ